MAATTGNRVRLNASFVEGVKHPATGKVVYMDADTPNFGLRVTPTEKTFFIRVKVHGESKERSLHPASALKVMTITQIREEATRKVLDLKRGVDFIEVQKQETERKRQERLASLTLSEALEEYLEKNPLLSERTASDYKGLMAWELAPYASTGLNDITRQRAEDMMREIIATLLKGRGKNGSRANHALRLVRTLCMYFEQGCQKWGRSGQKRTFPWVKTPPKKTLLDPEIGHGSEIWEALSRRRYDTSRDMLKTILLTGARVGEMHKLKVGDISIKNRTMFLGKTKNGEDHVVYMSDQLVEVVQENMTDRKTGEKRPAGDPLFLKCSDPKKMTEAISKEIDVKFSAHSLRKFFTITADHLGFTEAVYGKCVNHKPRTVTAMHYAHATPSMLRRCWQQVADFYAPRAAISLNAHREAA